MKRLTIKLIFASILIFMISSIVPNIVFMMFGQRIHDVEFTTRLVLIFGILSVATPVLLYSFLIDRLILRRMSRISKATKEVAKGNYDVKLFPNLNDEITDVMLNFNKMTNELKSNEYISKEFVRNFSHELKTPLSAIKGYSDLINQRDLTKEEIKEYSTIISQESERLSMMSKNMLQISLVDSKSFVQKNDTFNVSEQIRNAIQLMQLDWENKELVLNLELEEISILSNKEFLYQVWTNLISNAIKFSSQGEAIDISLLEVGDTIQFEITNSGSISKDDIEKVFDLFYIAEKSRTSKSNGVGLTLSKKIVTKLGGTISIESKEGKTTFLVNLPSY